jgi:hypothetical protein
LTKISPEVVLSTDHVAPPASGTFVLVAIVTVSRGAVQALKDGRLVDPSAVWTWCCRNPIPYETYAAVAEHGEPLPDEVPRIGHNSLALDVITEIADDVALLFAGWIEVVRRGMGENNS